MRNVSVRILTLINIKTLPPKKEVFLSVRRATFSRATAAAAAGATPMPTLPWHSTRPRAKSQGVALQQHNSQPSHAMALRTRSHQSTDASTPPVPPAAPPAAPHQHRRADDRKRLRGPFWTSLAAIMEQGDVSSKENPDRLAAMRLGSSGRPTGGPALPERLQAYSDLRAGQPFSEVSIVDLREPAEVVTAKLMLAVTTVGFVQVIGHEVDPAVEAAHERAMQAFFALPAGEKQALAVDRSSPVRGYFGKGGACAPARATWRPHIAWTSCSKPRACLPLLSSPPGRRRRRREPRGGPGGRRRSVGRRRHRQQGRPGPEWGAVGLRGARRRRGGQHSRDLPFECWAAD